MSRDDSGKPRQPGMAQAPESAAESLDFTQAAPRSDGAPAPKPQPRPKRTVSPPPAPAPRLVSGSMILVGLVAAAAAYLVSDGPSTTPPPDTAPAAAPRPDPAPPAPQPPSKPAVPAAKPAALPPAITQAFETYREKPGDKALAVALDGDGRWAYGAIVRYAGQSGANDEALAECARQALPGGIKAPCRLYAVGDRVVW